MPEINVLLDMEFEDPELEPTILPVDARLSFRGSVEELRYLFERVAALAPQKEKIPGTSFVHVAAADDTVTFTGTDGAQTLVLESSKLRVLRDGQALLPAQKLKSIFALAPEDHATVTVLGNTATITSGRAIWNITIPAGEKLHAVPDISGIGVYEVSRRSFFRALSAVRRALPTLGGRKSLEQVHVAAGALTASDGYRLLRHRVEGLSDKLNFSIPRDTVDEMLRSLTAGSDETFQLGADNELIVTKAPGETLVSRQLSLSFPDLEAQLIAPALENKYSLTVETNALRDLIKRVRISADPEYSAITLHFGKTKDGDWELTVSTRDRSNNSAFETMLALWEGEAEPFDITLNHRYLLDLLEAYMSRLATVRVGANTKTRAAPLLLRDDDKGFTAVIQQSLGR